MTYHIVFGLLLLLCWTQIGRPVFNFYYPVLVGLFLFSAFRFEVGCDWPNYILNFREQHWASMGDALLQPNPSHWVLLELMDILGLDYYWLNIVTSAIFFAGIHAVARRSPEPLIILVLAFPVLIMNMPMSAVKQAAAIGICCFAFNAFIDRRLILFVVLLFIAATFHSSALVFLVMAPFVHAGYTPRNLALAGVMAIPLLFLVMSTEAAEIATTRYIESDRSAQGAIFRLSLLILTGLGFFLLLSRRWANLFPESQKFIGLTAGAMVALAGLMLVSSVVADRFGYYLIIPALMIYSALPHLYSRGQMNLVKLAPFVALLVVFIGWTQLSGHYAACYDPYTTIIGKY